ncbi:MAG: ABC transporter permease, partial [Candidatus Heimdallarchaeota archaeon]|nr:ABC transporter permease [Candidatus Heimdallarchaeota archaeon]
MSIKGTKNASIIVAKKELKLLFKSKRRIFILSIMPIMIILIAVISGLSISYFEDEETPVKVLILDENPSDITSQLISLWETVNGTELEEVTGNYLDYSQSTKLEIFIFIPNNFTTQFELQESTELSIYYSMNSTKYEILAISILQLTLQFEQQILELENPDLEFDRIQYNFKRIEYNTEGLDEELAGQLFIIPVYIIFFLVFPPINLVLISVTLEREQRTLETLFLQPVRRRSIILGKVLYGFAIVGITTLLDIIAAVISFSLLLFLLGETDSDSSGEIIDIIESVGLLSIFMFILAIIVIALTIIVLAVLVSLLAKDEKEANMISGLLPLLMFSSIIVVMFVPINDMSMLNKSIFSGIPVIGVLIAIYLTTIAGKIVFISYLSIVIQFLWFLFFVKITVQLSEAE